MNILDTIIEHKAGEVAASKALVSVDALMKSELFNRSTFSLKQFLLDTTKTGIIAEYKRKSPSKGTINAHSTVQEVTEGYTQNGASCLSVLTDEHFFGGTSQDLINARFNEIPILRKEFIIDEYQIVEAKSIGADVILLIAACLSPERVKELAIFAKKLDLEILLEIHNEEELQHICTEIEIVGVNNRDLKTFTVDLNRSIALSKMIPEGKIKVAESGINEVSAIKKLAQAGFNGFLIGENFMKEQNPGEAFRLFTQQLK